MADIIIMPKLGFNMIEGKLAQWYKKEGEPVEKGEALFSVETDKTNMEIEATNAGIVRKLLVEAGETIAVTLPIAIVGDESEDVGPLVIEALRRLGREDGAKAAAAQPAAALEQTPPAAKTAGYHYDYDLLVIGGGPGGYAAAIKAAQKGKRVAIAEKKEFGGTCLNAGCIPTKALLRSAGALKEARLASRYGVTGIETARLALDLKQAQARKKKIVSQLAAGVAGLLAANGASCIKGEAQLMDAHTAIIGEKTVTAGDIIIATGSKAKTLPIPISDKMEVLTSGELLALEEAPASIAIIGGGVIGIEFAYFLAGIGTKVTVLEFMERILPMVEEEIISKVADALKEMGVTIYTGAAVREITDTGVKFASGGNVAELSVQKVLMAVGREPCLSGIDCAALGIKTEKGAIVTDAYMRTSAEHIYAVGDVNGKSMLAHTAFMEGMAAVENICGGGSPMEYSQIPSVVYLQPEIAGIGLTEAQARKKYGEIRVGRFPLAANGKAKVEGAEAGLAKVVVETSYGEIVGVHLWCLHASDLIAEAAAAMKLEATAEEFAAVIHPHPSLSEALYEAMLAAYDKPLHAL